MIGPQAASACQRGWAALSVSDSQLCVFGEHKQQAGLGNMSNKQVLGSGRSHHAALG